jgi:hypothetical protein
MKTDNKLLAEFLGWEHINIIWYGYPTEYKAKKSNPRQYELKVWLDKVGIESVGDYYIKVSTDFWIEANNWNPDKDWNDLMMIVQKLLIEKAYKSDHKRSLQYALMSADSDRVYQACVDYINYLNLPL